MSLRGEERAYTHAQVVARVREKLLSYISKLAEVLEENRVPQREGVVSSGSIATRKSHVDSNSGFYERVCVVDGGSSVFPLNAGYIGVVVAVAVLIEGSRVADRIVAEPEIVPGNPHEVDAYETLDLIGSVVDKVREALVFETAVKALNWNPELLIVDGPIIPYGALAKIVARTRSEFEAWERYRSAVLKLHGEASSKSVDVIGFVKRPRTRLLAGRAGFRGFDHVYLSRELKPGEYAPDPPQRVAELREYFHEPEVFQVVEKADLRFTYFRLTSSTPPFRVDFAHTARDYRDVLAYLYRTRTREGVPYPVMKADEDTKITRKLARELYEDILHTYAVERARGDPEKLIPLLPEYGGL